MSKFCSKCGNEMNEADVFCKECGNSDNQTINVNNASNVIEKREIALAVVFTIITCGLYGIYWFIVMTDESNRISDDNKTSGGMAFLFSLITCGIYGIYWNYKMGKKLYEAGQKYGKVINDNSIIYLILSIFGCSLINYCLIQSDLNKFSE
jgi:cytochrome bd-type quinol oxidase subunit 2